VDYLKGLKGDCKIPAGPGKCTRVSCSYGSGKYACNDNNSEFTVSWATIVDMVDNISRQCHEDISTLDRGVRRESGSMLFRVSSIMSPQVWVISRETSAEKY